MVVPRQARAEAEAAGSIEVIQRPAILRDARGHRGAGDHRAAHGRVPRHLCLCRAARLAARLRERALLSADARPSARLHGSHAGARPLPAAMAPAPHDALAPALSGARPLARVRDGGDRGDGVALGLCCRRRALPREQQAAARCRAPAMVREARSDRCARAALHERHRRDDADAYGESRPGADRPLAFGRRVRLRPRPYLSSARSRIIMFSISRAGAALRSSSRMACSTI